MDHQNSKRVHKSDSQEAIVDLEMDGGSPYREESHFEGGYQGEQQDLEDGYRESSEHNTTNDCGLSKSLESPDPTENHKM